MFPFDTSSPPVDNRRAEGTEFRMFSTVGRPASGHHVRQLQDDHDDAVATQSQRRARVQRLRTLLQAAQRKTPYLFSHRFVTDAGPLMH